MIPSPLPSKGTKPHKRIGIADQWAQSVESQTIGNADLATGLANACRTIAGHWIAKRSRYRIGDCKRLHWTDILSEAFLAFRRAESKGKPISVNRCAKLAYVTIIRQYQLSSERKRVPTLAYAQFVATRAKFIREAVQSGMAIADAKSAWKQNNVFEGIRYTVLNASQWRELVASKRNAPVSLDAIDSRRLLCAHKYFDTIDNQGEAIEFVQLVREHMGHKFGSVLLAGFSIRRACMELVADQADQAETDESVKVGHWQTVYRRWTNEVMPALAKRFDS